jgi:predicted outer membrane repeat protein
MLSTKRIKFTNIRVIEILIICFWISVCEASIIHVPSDYSSIQNALNGASEGDTVKVASGIYYENIIWPSTDGIQLIGNGEDTVINGGQASHVIELSTSFRDIITSKTLVSAFKITNGKHFEGRGGGIYCKNSSPCLSNLIIEGNYANEYGGGFFAIHSSPELSDSVIQGNKLNNSTSGGAGLAIMYSTLKLKNVVIQENTSSGYGGGIYCTDSELNATNILIVKNFSYNSGGGIYSFESTVNVVNATIHGNVTNANQGVNAGGVFLVSTNSSIINSILWDNTDFDIIFYCSNDLYSLWVEYSNIKGGKNSIGIPYEYYRDKIKWLEGNLIVNPLFVDPDNKDFHLDKNSQCIDAGHPDLDYDGITWENDIDDQDKNGTRMDMGYMYSDPEILTYSISGRVISNGLGMGGVKITFLNQHVFTDSEGQFIINDILNKSEGKVIPFKEGVIFSPAYISLKNINSNRYADFVETEGAVHNTEPINLKNVIYFLKILSKIP